MTPATIEELPAETRVLAFAGLKLREAFWVQVLSGKDTDGEADRIRVELGEAICGVTEVWSSAELTRSVNEGLTLIRRLSSGAGSTGRQLRDVSGLSLSAEFALAHEIRAQVLVVADVFESIAANFDPKQTLFVGSLVNIARQPLQSEQGPDIDCLAHAVSVLSQAAHWMKVYQSRKCKGAKS